MKRNLVGKIFGITLVFVMVASMFGGLTGTAAAAKFSIDDTVEVYNTGSSGLVVRDTSCGSQIGGKFDGALGTVLDGPVFCNNYNRWEIRWLSDGLVGWSAEDWLREVYPSTVTAAIDKQLLDLIDQYASSFYNPAWNLNIDQYKAWIATIAWAEGGKGGYVAHSQGAPGSDRFDHRVVGSNFRFSTGIGPFQLDRGGGTENWGTWPTIDKLDPEKAVQSVLRRHHSMFGTGSSLEDFANNSPWYAVNPTQGGNTKAHWEAVTGTNWDVHKNGKANLDWSSVRNQLAQNANNPSFRYENNVQLLGTVKWNIKENEGIKTDTGKKVIFDGPYQTWLITSRSWSGTELFKYYYTYKSDEGIEVWVWDNSDDPVNKFKYIFVREYSTGPLPERREGSLAGETLTSSAIGEEDTIDPTVDAFSVSPSSVTLGDAFTISYTVSDTGGSGLKQVELWRANDIGGVPDWGEYPIDNPKDVTPLSGQTSYSGSFSDAPPSVGSYWYGMHVVDNAGNWAPEDSPIEVEVIKANNPPQLSNGYVDPSSGSPSTNFYYYVTYFDPDGDSPSVKQVIIDGTAYTMEWYSGLNSHITYRYGPKNLSAGGTHYYFFYFEDGRGGWARLPTGIDMYLGPSVGSETYPPTVITVDASSVTTTSAVLNGHLDDLGSASSVNVSFQWGETTAYGKVADTVTMTEAGPFCAILSDLLPDTAYHFRAKAVGDGISYGNDKSFTTTSGEVVTFPDPNLEAAIREAIDKPSGDIYQSDLNNLTSLCACSENIVNLTGLEHCTSLTRLHLGDNQISDITPLSGLTSLIDLGLWYNQISDITPLSGLTSLTALWLWDNQISDITPLSTLTSLTRLHLQHNQISDISSLSNLTSLIRLSLWDNQISDIKPLVDNSGLAEGDEVDLRSNPLSATSLNTYVPQLEARGVVVYYDALPTQTWYVDDDLQEYPSADFTKIQEAVDNASAGDTIIVYPGTYTENVDVNKDHLTIKSENGADSTIVQAANPDVTAFVVTADYVDITGFTIKGAGNSWGICLSEHTDHCNISDNIVSNNYHGIYLYSSSNNALNSNTVSSNYRIGIYLQDSSSNTLSDNIMSDNQYNFNVDGWELSHFTHNIDTSNKVNGRPIQYLMNKHDLVIDSSWHVGYLGLVNCTNMTVKDLTMSYNRQGVLLAYSSDSKVENVTASNNHYGIYLYSSSNNTLRNNTISSDNHCGIYLEYSSQNKIMSNTISNGSTGLELRLSNNNSMMDNTVSNNTWGIRLWWSGNSTLRNNIISGNSYNFDIHGWELSDFINDVDTSNKVEGKPIYYWVNQNNKQIPSDAGYVAAVNCENIIVKDLSLKNNEDGVLFAYTKNSRIEDITVSENSNGIHLFYSNNNEVVNNTILDNCGEGILLDISSGNNLEGNIISSNDSSGIQLLNSGSTNNDVINNNISNTGYGIWLDYSGGSNNIINNNVSNCYHAGIYSGKSPGNDIYLNNFNNARSWDSTNIWNSTEEITYAYKGNTYTSYLGNYWSDYENRYPDADEIDSTGIWDTPYGIDLDADNYPLVEPFENYEIGPGPKTWYVDDDLQDYPAADFTTIQEAVDAATSGDTIIVYPGTYTENVDVNKDYLTIKSENGANSTIVEATDPDDSVFQIEADCVNLSGFMVKGALDMNGNRRSEGIWLNGANSCNISQNIACDNYCGICLDSSLNNVVVNNTAWNNSEGIDLRSSSNNTLTGNTVSNSSWTGIHLGYSSNNTLIDNTFLGNKCSLSVGGGELSDFINDIDTSNKVNGKSIQYLVGQRDLVIDSSWDVGYLGLVNCTNITVKDLTLDNNSDGILLAYCNDSRIEDISLSNDSDIKLIHSYSNSLTSNIISNCVRGIYLSHSYNNTLTGNIISNASRGIHLSHSYNNTLIGNTVFNTTAGLIFPVGGMVLSNSFDNTLANNDISNNFVGVALLNSSNNTLTNNLMSDNLYNFWTGGSYLYGFINNIDTSNKVNGKSIQYLIDQQDLVIDSGWDVGYLGLVNCTNITVRDLTLTNNGQGVLLAYSHNSRIENVNLLNHIYGILLQSSSNITLTQNTVSDNFGYVIMLDFSSNNVIYLNNFLDNDDNVDSSGWITNTWNSPEEITYTYNGNTYTGHLGNYWGDYEGKYPDANETDSSGIWDTTYLINSDKDNYPLVDPFENYILWETGTLDITVCDAPDPFTPPYETNTIRITNEGTIPCAITLSIEGINRNWEWENVAPSNSNSVEAVWDGRDGLGNLVSAGTYTYTATGSLWTGNPWSVEVTGTITVVYPDTTPPTVVSMSPEAGASNVPIDTNVTAMFSEPINSSTVTSESFTLQWEGSEVPGTVTYDPDTYTATFTPHANLNYDHTYTATLNTTITDLAGNALAEPYSWSFTTEPAPSDTTAPTAVTDLGTVDITSLGFVYPTGKSEPYAYAGWLAGGPGMPPYQEGYYHVGQDMEANEGNDVYAIADGEIVYISVSGWGGGNYGLLVKHRLDTGEEFLALHGHVRPNRDDLRYAASGPVAPSVPVTVGEAFATIGPYDSIPHLHFGIHPGSEVPASPWGRMPLDQWPDTNDFVDPVNWLTTRTPFNPLDPTSSIMLAWTAPGDDGEVGTASEYDIRYSTSEITEANWDSATQYEGEPAPQSAGSSESLTVTELPSNTAYYFALKTADEVPNWSGLSNVASGTTTAPNQPPVASFTCSQENPSSGDVVSFDACSSYDPEGTIISYEWNFGDGETAMGQQVTHRFRGAMGEAKECTVELRIEDDKGATNSNTHTVTVYPLKRHIPVYSSLCQFLPPPLPMIMEVVVYYNWVDEKEGQDEYIVSEVHLSNEESLNFALYMFSIEDEGEKVWNKIHKGVGKEDVSFTYPFGVPRDCVKSIGDEHFEGLALGPNGRLNFVVHGVELGLELGPRFFHVSRTIELGPGKQTELPPICPEGTPGIVAAVASPVELRVYGFDGNVTGLVDGEIREEIPNSMYDGQSGTCVIFSPEDIDSNRYETVGIGEGTYGLEITSVKDGDPATFTATDIPTASGAVHQYTIDWDALSEGEEGVTVQVDSDGDGIFEQTIKSDATLQPPTAEADGPYVGDEGSPIMLSASGSYDPDGNVTLYEWDFDGDGIYDANSTSSNITHTWGDDYSGPVTLRVTDDDGLTGVDTAEVTVNNVPPTVDAGPDQEVFASDTVNFSGNFTDPGWLDTHTGTWNFGDEASEAGVVTEENNPPDATGTVIGSHIYYDKGTYTVTLRVEDGDGGIGTDTLTVNVKPIQATIDFDPDTLNLNSGGKWVTVYIEMAEGPQGQVYDVAEIDASTILLNGEIAPVLDPRYGFVKSEESYIMDHDGDGILERMVKFDRAAVQEILSVGDEVTITITGKVSYNEGLAHFEGSDIVRVIKPGK